MSRRDALEFAPKALRALRKLDRPVVERIKAATESLRDDPRPAGAKISDLSVSTRCAAAPSVPRRPVWTIRPGGGSAAPAYARCASPLTGPAAEITLNEGGRRAIEVARWASRRGHRTQIDREDVLWGLLADASSDSARILRRGHVDLGRL